MNAVTKRGSVAESGGKIFGRPKIKTGKPRLSRGILESSILILNLGTSVSKVIAFSEGTQVSFLSVFIIYCCYRSSKSCFLLFIVVIRYLDCSYYSLLFLLCSR